MSYKKALEILRALPVEEQILASGTYKFYVDGKAACGCAVGKIFPTIYKELKQGDAGIDDCFYTWMGIYEGTHSWQMDFNTLDITDIELDELQDENDGFASFKDKEGNFINSWQKDAVVNTERNSEELRKARYHHIVRWLEDKIQDERIKEDNSEG